MMSQCSFQRYEFADRVHIFWVKQCSHMYASCSRNVLREVATYLRECFRLVYISDDHKLLAFDCKTHSSSLLYTFTHCQRSDFEGYTLIDNYRLIMCGGLDSPNSKQHTGAFLLDIRTSTLGKLPPMTTARRYSPGMVCERSRVYVFGGTAHTGLGTTDTSDLARTGEALQLLGENWGMLEGRMSNTRVYFSPCLFEDRIYLCGGGVSYEVDICYEGLISSLALSLLDNDSVAVVHSKQLLFISQNCTTRLGGASEQHQERKFRLVTKAAPVLYKDTLYFADGAKVKSVQFNSSFNVIKWTIN